MYLVYWKEFTVESNTWRREKNLENVNKVVAEFKGKMGVKV